MLMIGIQQTHTIAIHGAQLPALRTGYESVVPYRVSALYATHAPDTGVVESMSEKGFTVKYKDGSIVGYRLGRLYGRAEGHYYAHDQVTNVKLGGKVVKDQPLTWNSGFFELDFMNPGRLCMKTGLTTTIALMESKMTFEDSNGITERLSRRKAATTVKVRSFVIGFKQGVRKIVKEGQKVEPEDVLLMIEDEMTNDTGLFDSDDIDSLKRLSGKAPKAAVIGTIDRIEVLYHGSISDMGTSLKAIAKASDKQLHDEFTAMGKPVMTGKVDGEYRVGGKPLVLDTLEIKIYISSIDIHASADKNVFCNQMKTTTAGILPHTITAEDGTEIDGVFSYRGFGARIVGSPLRIGTTTTLLKLGGEKAFDIYHGRS